MKPRILISGCLAGQRVRYDGDSVRNNWLTEIFAKHVEFVPVCPEMGMGLGAPREAMRLQKRKDGSVSLITSRTKQDMTDRAEQSIAKIMSNLPKDLDGVILMGRSPTCGTARVKVYDDNDSPQRNGVGMFAKEILASCEGIPVVEVGRLSDPIQRRHFLIRLFTQHRFRQVPVDIAEIQRFHRENKYLLMSHSPDLLRTMGKLAANHKALPIRELWENYEGLLFQALACSPTQGKIQNSLAHVYGYFKARINTQQKDRILDNLQKIVVDGQARLQIVLELLAYENMTQENEYITQQTIFSPYPEEVM